MKNSTGFFLLSAGAAFCTVGAFGGGSIAPFAAGCAVWLGLGAICLAIKLAIEIEPP